MPWDHALSRANVFSAIANADQKTKTAFVQALYESFLKIADAFKTRKLMPFYWSAFDDKESGSAIPKTYFMSKPETKKMIASAMKNNVIADVALEHQRVCFFDLLKESNGGTGCPGTNYDSDDILVFSFLYQCTLEALRIVALFHDVGHPPYSHILEDTLCELYDKCVDAGIVASEGFCSEKAQEVVDMLGPFRGSYNPPSLLLCPSGGIQTPLHEQIGLTMLQNAFSGVLPGLRTSASEEQTASSRTARCLYYVAVVEFAFAILLEQTPVFAALHRIVDGPVDADRLDYVMRDSVNAGIDWGHIPYPRVIGSVRLVSADANRFFLAFPEKMADGIEDILVVRYKIFSRINFHHRSTKTARLLQKAVRLLAEDYLKAPKDSDCICPGICDLWMSLGGSLGVVEEENKIAKWNDSWLISTLHSALIQLSDAGMREKLEGAGSNADTQQRIQELLEEILVNRKRYFSLLKRQKDAKKLIKGIFEKAGMTNDLLTRVLEYEYGKLLKATGEDSEEARESLYRISVLRDKIYSEASIEDLEIYFPFGYCHDIITDVLKRAKEDDKILDFIVSLNAARVKLGITDRAKDWIYLYQPNGETYLYDINETLIPLLLAQRTNCLWLNVYVEPRDRKQSIETLEYLMEQIEFAIGAAFKEKFSELFPPHEPVCAGAAETAPVAEPSA